MWRAVTSTSLVHNGSFWYRAWRAKRMHSATMRLPMSSARAAGST
jgi:hypothetical protein